jgi:hypothetical protein
MSQNQVNFGEMNLPVRMTRNIGVSGTWGWNGLTGLGATLQYYISPHFGLDAGLGLALSGYKFSGRVRYLFLEKNFSPLIGVGYIYSTGFPGQLTDFEDEDGRTVTVEILPSSFIQIVGGIEFVVNGGFFMMANLGYAIQINDNVNYIAGSPSANFDRAMQIIYRNGIVFEISIGYIFGNKGKFKGKL